MLGLSPSLSLLSLSLSLSLPPSLSLTLSTLSLPLFLSYRKFHLLSSHFHIVFDQSLTPLKSSGELSLGVIRLIATIRSTKTTENVSFQCKKNPAGLGFTLPQNLGDLDPAILDLDLSDCCLMGELSLNFPLI